MGMKKLLVVFLILPAPLFASTDIQSVYKLAVKLVKQKEYDNALRYFQVLIKKEPENSRWHYLRARVHYLNKDLMAALKSCAKTSGEFASKCEVLFDKAKEKAPQAYAMYEAEVALDDKKPDLAIEKIMPYLKEDIYSPRMRLSYGRAMEQKGRLDVAMDHYLFVKDSVALKSREKVQDYIDSLAEKADEIVAFLESNSMPTNPGEDQDEYFQLYYLALRLQTRTFDPEASRLGRIIEKYLFEKLDTVSAEKKFAMLYSRAFILALLGDKKDSRQVFRLARKNAGSALEDETAKFFLDKLADPF